jgi:tetratricopeptide (TPR) repeat protein
MKKLLFGVILLALEPSFAISAPTITLDVSPIFSFPSQLDENAEMFDFATGTDIAGEYQLPFSPALYAKASLGYAFTQLVADSSLSIFSGSAGIGLRFPIGDRMTFKADLAGGYYYGFVNATGQGGGGALVSGGPGLVFRLGPSIGIGIGAGYRVYFDLIQTWDIVGGLSFALGPSAPMIRREAAPRPQPLVAGVRQPAPGAGLSISSLSFVDVFPIFYTYYDRNAIGKLTLRNDSGSSVTELSVSLFIRQYMDMPKECAAIVELKTGEARDVDLYALFKNNILEVTENTKVAAELSVSYTQNGKAAALSKGETIRVYKRNAMTWDDDRKAASFVTANDLAVLSFSNNINAALKGKTNRALDKNLQTAMALHDALRLFGISYVSNPLASYADVSTNKRAVDTLKFPRETFAYKSGDCSDLSILYCALMESVQIETAFITIPGHIFMAFALKMSPEEARAAFSRSDELIFRNEKAWVPVEVTEREKTFLDAWQTGAKEWRENQSRNLAGFFPIREAWNTYETVGLPGTSSPPAIPETAKLLQDFNGDVSRFIQLEIYSKVAELQAAISKSQQSAKAVNALGVLYARYDLVEQAEAQFLGILRKGEYVPALVNLGNLYFLGADFEKALSFYDRAYEKSPKDPNVLLGMARASQELEDYRTVRKTYDELKKASPYLAQQFAYLELKGEESTRAASISGAKEMVVWAEE